jgi:hypothetical protein
MANTHIQNQKGQRRHLKLGQNKPVAGGSGNSGKMPKRRVWNRLLVAGASGFRALCGQSGGPKCGSGGKKEGLSESIGTLEQSVGDLEKSMRALKMSLNELRWAMPNQNGQAGLAQPKSPNEENGYWQNPHAKRMRILVIAVALNTAGLCSSEGIMYSGGNIGGRSVQGSANSGEDTGGTTRQVEERISGLTQELSLEMAGVKEELRSIDGGLQNVLGRINQILEHRREVMRGAGWEKE